MAGSPFRAGHIEIYDSIGLRVATPRDPQNGSIRARSPVIDVLSVVTAASVFAGALFERERSDKSAFRPFSLDVSAFIAYPNKLRALFGFKLGLNENGFFR